MKYVNSFLKNKLAEIEYDLSWYDSIPAKSLTMLSISEKVNEFKKQKEEIEKAIFILKKGGIKKMKSKDAKKEIKKKPKKKY